jgi:hypothetical protein
MVAEHSSEISLTIFHMVTSQKTIIFKYQCFRESCASIFWSSPSSPKMGQDVPPKVNSYLPATQRHTAEDCSLNVIRILKSHNFQLITMVHEWKDYGSSLLSRCINCRDYYILNKMVTEKAGIWAFAWSGSWKQQKSPWLRFKPCTSWVKVCHVTAWDKLLGKKLKTMYPKKICLLLKRKN